jgi:integrase
VTKRTWFRRDRTAEDSREWWTPAEEEKAMALLLGSWHERDLQAAVTLTTQLLLGLRFSEVRALEKKDLDLQAPGIWIRRSQARKIVSTPKNKRARFHVIPRALADELRKFMLRTKEQLLFPDPRGLCALEQGAESLVPRPRERGWRSPHHQPRRPPRRRQ